MKCVVNVSLLIDIQRRGGEKTAVVMRQKKFFFIFLARFKRKWQIEFLMWNVLFHINIIIIIFIDQRHRNEMKIYLVVVLIKSI